LSSWEAILKRVRFQENEEVLRSRSALTDFSTNKMNWKRWTYEDYGEVLGFGQTKFKGENQTMLQLEEFENILMSFIFVSQFLETNYYPKLEAAIDEILALVEKNIEQ